MSLACKLELREQYAALAPPVAPPPAPTVVTMEGRLIQCLSMAEQEECRRLGLCYNYDEKFIRGHNCICRRLFLLDSTEEDMEDLAESSKTAALEGDSSLFSLHAMAGVRFADTMQLGVSVGNTDLIALLDPGSTHNFIFEFVA